MTDATSEQEGRTLLLRGRVFRLIPKCPPGVIFDFVEGQEPRAHLVGAGETVETIAAQYRIGTGALRRWNAMNEDEELTAGRVVNIRQPSMEWAARYQRMLTTLVVDEDQERLRALLYDRVDPPTFPEIEAFVVEAIAGYAGRPTERPSSSPSGAEPTETRSTDDSPSPGTARVVSMSPKGGISAAS